MTEPELRDNPAESRFEAWVDQELAGLAAYKLADGLIVFTHTEVDPRFEGRGLGSALVRFALDEVRAAGHRRVRPLCPFVKAWIGRHREYADLVHGASRSATPD